MTGRFFLMFQIPTSDFPIQHDLNLDQLGETNDLFVHHVKML